MANGNVLVQALRGALSPLVLEKQRQQELTDEFALGDQKAQLAALLEAFKQQGRSNLQGQRDAAAGDRLGFTQGAIGDRLTARNENKILEEGRDLSGEIGALDIPGISGLARALAESGAQPELVAGAAEAKRGAGIRDRASKEREEAEKFVRKSISEDQRSANIAGRQGGPSSKPEKISTFDGFKQEVSNEVNRMMKNFAKANQPMDELRAEAVARVVERNGGSLVGLDTTRMSERDVFNALKQSLAGRDSSKTMSQINEEVLGGR